MTPFSQLRLDPVGIDTGRWFTHPSGFRWRICSIRKKAFRRRMNELLEPSAAIRSAAPESDLARAERDKALVRAYAEQIVVGWDGMIGDDGAPMPFAPDAVLAILEDPLYAHVYDWCATCAALDFTAATETRDLGNSGGGSAGS